MDYLRACYRVRMKLFSDSDQLYWVRWYFTEPSAKLWPSHHFFASQIWQRDKTLPLTGVGEGSRFRQFVYGRNDGAFRGKCFRGKAEWFRDGAPVEILSQPPPPPRDCCQRTPAAGILFDGTGILALVPPPAARIAGLRLSGTGLLTSSSAPGTLAGLLLDGTGGLFGVPPPPNIAGLLLDGTGGLAVVPPPPNVGGLLLDGSGTFATVPPSGNVGGLLLDGQGTLATVPPSGTSAGVLFGGTGVFAMTGVGLMATINGRVHINATQTTSAGGHWVKVLLDTVDFDPSGVWDAVNKNWKPTQAGYYLCSARVRFNATNNSFAVAIGKNGSENIAIGGDGGTALAIAHGGSALIFCNGTTDTIDLRCYTDNVGTFTTGSFDTWLSIIGPC